MGHETVGAKRPQTLIERFKQAGIIGVYEDTLPLVGRFFSEFAHHGLASAEVG